MTLSLIHISADLIAGQRHEQSLYDKYKEYYGYVFYIGQKSFLGRELGSIEMFCPTVLRYNEMEMCIRDSILPALSPEIHWLPLSNEAKMCIRDR